MLRVFYEHLYLCFQNDPGYRYSEQPQYDQKKKKKKKSKKDRKEEMEDLKQEIEMVGGNLGQDIYMYIVNDVVV